MRAVILLLFLLLVSSKAEAFPENTRYGYSGCGSCHVSPTGGGVLTEYGKRSTEDLLSGQSYEKEGDVLHNLVATPDNIVNVGGDIRWISYQAYGLRRAFLMQADIEAATELPGGITVAASGGLYGKMSDPMSRRHYIRYQPTTELSLRIGRFFPAYGIHHADHTVVTRRSLGFGEGRETYNAELAYIASWGEIFITEVLGTDVAIGMDNQGYSLYSKSELGLTARAAYYLGESSQVGLSLLRLDYKKDYRQAFGAYLLWGLTENAYVLAEVDRQQTLTEPQFIAYTKLGVETIKGLTVFMDYGFDGGYQTNLGVQWYPRPHYEIQASMGAIARRLGEASDTATLLLHHYF